MFDDTLAMRLRGAYLTFHRLAGAHFERSGMTADQYVVLTILAEEPGLSQREVVDRAYSDANTIGAILRRLQQKRLVRREHHPHDGRAWRVLLTDKGRKLQRQVRAESKSMHEKLTQLFRSAELRTLERLLARIPPAMTDARKDAAEEAA